MLVYPFSYTEVVIYLSVSLFSSTDFLSRERKKGNLETQAESTKADTNINPLALSLSSILIQQKQNRNHEAKRRHRRHHHHPIHPPIHSRFWNLGYEEPRLVVLEEKG